MSTVQVRKKKEAGAYECVAENGNGDPVSATAELTVFEGDFDREEEYGEHDRHIWDYDFKKLDSFELHEEMTRMRGDFYIWMNFKLWINLRRVRLNDMNFHCRKSLVDEFHMISLCRKNDVFIYKKVDDLNEFKIWRFEETNHAMFFIGMMMIWIKSSKNMISQKKHCRLASRKLSRILPWRFFSSSWINIVILSLVNIINIVNIVEIVKIVNIVNIVNIVTLMHLGGGKGSTCCVGVRSFWKPKADNHMDQGHDAHRPEGKSKTEPYEAR